MRIAAFDPGGTTGVATIDTARSNIIRTYNLGPGPHHMALWRFLNDYEADVHIAERFMYQRRELTKGVSLVLDSVEYIGILKLYCGEELIIQTPAQAKNFWSDDKLKRLRYWVGKSAHERDAVRHLLYYLAITQGDQSWIIQAKG